MSREKIAVLTDSCADVPPHLAKRYHIAIVPLKIIYQDRAYLDGIDITPEEVYNRLPIEIPKTSLPDGETVGQIFRNLKAEGYTSVIAIIFSSGLSGTYQMVKLVSEEFPELRTAVFDTLSGCLGTGATALQTARYIEEGKTWDELMDLIPRLIQNTKVFFSINTLEYLQKGGRIGKITSIAGTMLNMKPIISFAPTGELINVAKIRGRKQSLMRITELVTEFAAEHPGKRYNLMFASGGAPEDLKTVRQTVLKLLPKRVNCWEGEIDSTLGVYVGPKLIGAGIQILEDDM